MQRVKILISVLAVTAGVAAIAVASTGASFTMRDMMSPAEYRAAGIAKLTDAERAALDQWLTSYSYRLVAAVVEQPSPTPSSRPQVSRRAPSYGSAAGSTRTYAVEVARDDELFIINGEKFAAQTYCFGWRQGDPVIFLEGSALGACASAVLFNKRTETKCAVWCE